MSCSEKIRAQYPSRDAGYFLDLINASERHPVLIPSRDRAFIDVAFCCEVDRPDAVFGEETVQEALSHAGTVAQRATQVNPVDVHPC